MTFKPRFANTQLPPNPSKIAPDGSEVRVLLTLEGGGIAHFQLAPGKVSVAVKHLTVEEIWYIVSGSGEMWRMQNDLDETLVLEPGICLSIPVGTHFQFKSTGPDPLEAIAATMPPWPEDREEAVVVNGRWEPEF